MDIKWPSESVAAASRANYQANGVNATDEMGLGDERRESKGDIGDCLTLRQTATEGTINVC